MKIVVCVKQVPDSAAKVVVEDGQASWGDAPLVINPWDEYAVETALLQQETHGGDVIVISVGAGALQKRSNMPWPWAAARLILISELELEGS